MPTSPASYSHNQAVDDVAEVMKHLMIEKGHFVACSMGSRTAFDFALRHAKKTMSVTLIGIGSGGDPRQPDFQEKAEMAYELARKRSLVRDNPGITHQIDPNPAAPEDGDL